MAATLVLRTVKGSPLTNLEVDNNFSNLNTFGDVVSANVGVLTSLSTGAKGNTVVAINELFSNIGILSSLTTSAKSNLVSAINELQSESTSNVTITGGTISGVIITNSTWNGNTVPRASTIDVTNDTATNSTHYLHFGTATSGNVDTKVSSTKLTFNPSSGLLTSTDYNSSSDITLKDNIKNIENALEVIKSLQGKSYTWKESGLKGFGLIAQDVEQIIPEIVTDNNGIKGINYINIIAILIEAVKDLSSQIDQLKK